MVFLYLPESEDAITKANVAEVVSLCIILDIFAACYNFFSYKDNALLAGSAILSEKLVVTLFSVQVTYWIGNTA